MMANDYKSYGLKLLKNGYVPLPLKPGEKRPAVKSWSEVKVTSDKVNNWADRLPEGGVGLRGGELVALDIDVDLSKTTVKNLVNWCKRHIGEPMIRVGKAPKVALFYRTDEPFSRRDSAYYGDDPKHAQHIEARSLDTQTVAFGEHPDTHQPYTWLSDATPLNTPIHSLPSISHTEIDAFYEYFDELAKHNRWPIQADLMPDMTDSGDWMKGKYEISDVDLIAALGFIDADDYHRWVSVGMALYHQFDGDYKGLQMWDDWSQKSSKYDDTTEKKWDSFKDHGKRRTATVGSILHLAAAKGWKNPGVHQEPPEPEFPQQAENKEESTPLEQFALTRLWGEPAPEVPWVIKDFIPANKVCMLTAPGGTGKSFFTLQLAFAVATGTPLAGYWEDITMGPVLMVSAEDDIDDVHRRLEVIIATIEDDFQYDDADIARIKRDFHNNFRFVSMVGKNAQLTYKANGQVEQTKAVDWLIKATNRLPGCAMVAIDPISRFKAGDENNQDDMTKFVNALERIRNETGAGILAVHHANKASMREGGATEQYAARGASALTDGVRWQANMAKMHPDDAKDYGVKKDMAGFYVQIAVAKTNYTAPHGGIWLKREEGGVLMAVEMDKFKKQRTEEEIDTINHNILSVVQRKQEANEPLSVDKLKRDYGGVNNELGCAVNTVPGHVDKLIDDGKLIKTKREGAGGGHVLSVPKNDD